MAPTFVGKCPLKNFRNQHCLMRRCPSIPEINRSKSTQFWMQIVLSQMNNIFRQHNFITRNIPSGTVRWGDLDLQGDYDNAPADFDRVYYRAVKILFITNYATVVLTCMYSSCPLHLILISFYWHLSCNEWWKCYGTRFLSFFWAEAVNIVGVFAGKKYFLPLAGFHRFRPAKSDRKWQ